MKHKLSKAQWVAFLSVLETWHETFSMPITTANVAMKLGWPKQSAWSRLAKLYNRGLLTRLNKLTYVWKQPETPKPQPVEASAITSLETHYKEWFEALTDKYERLRDQLFTQASEIESFQQGLKDTYKWINSKLQEVWKDVDKNREVLAAMPENKQSTDLHLASYETEVKNLRSELALVREKQADPLSVKHVVAQVSQVQNQLKSMSELLAALSQRLTVLETKPTTPQVTSFWKAKPKTL